MRKIVIFLMAFSAVLFSQISKSKILGTITDSKTGEPLIGVNVMVQGTYYGASTNSEGFYEIKAVSPGDYTIKVSYIGYKMIQQTGVKILPFDQKHLDFAMEETVLAMGQSITVIGEKPLLDVEDTSTRHRVTSEEIEQRIVTEVSDIVSQQSGVVETDNEIHIRGGRAHENSFLVDGISVQDPLSGTGFGLRVSADAIEEIEVITGGFNAEYGQAMSGVVRVKTKEGSEKLKGSVKFRTDYPRKSEIPEFSFLTDAVDVSLMGSIPTFSLLPGELQFFSTASMFITDSFLESADSLFSTTGYGSKFTPRQNNDWSGMFNLTWKIDQRKKLKASISRSLNISQNTRALQSTLDFERAGPGYPHSFQNNLNNFNVFTNNVFTQSLHWTQTISSKTFYKLKFSRFYAKLRSQVGDLWWYEYTKAQDMVQVPGDGIDDKYYYQPPDSNYAIVKSDGFYDVGNGNTWHDHFVESFSLQGDWTSNINQFHEVKSGFKFSATEMQLIDIVDPWFGGLGLNNDLYNVSPRDGAFYLQDKITFEGLVINVGMRYDLWIPGEFVDEAVADTTLPFTDAMRQAYKDDTFNLFGMRAKGRIEPRIGISHPVSDKQVLFFSYGHFSKRPKPQQVYTKLGDHNSYSTYQIVGNPNLNPETTVTYEFGIKHSFTSNDVLTLTAYNRDMFGYVTTVSVSGHGRFSAGYLTYINLDYARVRGIELDGRKRLGKYFSAQMTGSYSIATGKNSSPQDNLLVAAGVLSEEPIKENFLRWDRPFQLTASLNFFSSKGKHLQLFGLRLPDQWNLNLRFFFESGKRYTPYIFGPTGNYIKDYQNPYSEESPTWKWIDLKFDKYFKIGHHKMSIFFEVTNLFNWENDAIINAFEGRAWRTGDLVIINGEPWNPEEYNVTQPGQPQIFHINPSRFREPRHFMMGVSYRF